MEAPPKLLINFGSRLVLLSIKFLIKGFENCFLLAYNNVCHFL